MKTFWQFFLSKLQDPLFLITVSGLSVFSVMNIAIFFHTRHSNIIWTNILLDISGILFVGWIILLGIIIIRNKYLPIFIIPITGVPAIIIGSILVGVATYIVVRLVWREIITLMQIFH